MSVILDIALAAIGGFLAAILGNGLAIWWALRRQRLARARFAETVQKVREGRGW